MYGKTAIEYYDNLEELFKKTDVSSDVYNEYRYEGARRGFMTTAKGDYFHGRFGAVYSKWRDHNVKKEASMMDGIISDINASEFKECSWVYKTRLEEGDSIDINRFLDGHEKFWCGVRRVMKDKKVVRVYLNIGGSCGRSREELAVCGAVGTTVCEVLESMGIATELWAASMSRNLFDYSDGKYTNGGTVVRLKDSNEFADLGMINFICGDSHVFRNIIFRSWWMLGERIKQQPSGCLGQHAELSMDDLGLEEEERDGVLIIPSLYNVEEARKYLINFFNGVREKQTGEKKEES